MMAEEYKARSYQTDVTNQIIDHSKYMVVLDMGLGKTVSTLTAINELMNDSFEIRRTLIIAPLKVADLTWPEEMKKWDHLKYISYSMLTGDLGSRIDSLKMNSQIFIINVDNVKWLINLIVTHHNRKWPFDMIVIDESSKFKGYGSERFKAIQLACKVSKRVVLLTGTPAPNGLQDLWSQVYLIDSGARLGKNITAFRRRYMYPHPRIPNVWLMRDGVEKEIYDKIADISYVLKAKGNIDLPERIDNYIEINMDEATKAKYEELESSYLLSVDENEIEAANAAVLSNKLLQLTNGAIYDEDRNVYHIHDLKLEALKDILEDNEGKSVLVFYWFNHDLSRLKEYFKDYDPRELLTAKDKEDWDSRKIRLLLAHPASMSYGLNLQYGGSTIVWFGLTWSLELYQQANARLYRSGQKEVTVINHLVVKDSYDEYVIKRLKQKHMSQEDLKDAIIERRKKYEQLRYSKRL
jgi:SNF2 family DNA or RNA helicase